MRESASLGCLALGIWIASVAGCSGSDAGSQARAGGGSSGAQSSSGGSASGTGGAPASGGANPSGGTAGDGTPGSGGTPSASGGAAGGEAVGGSAGTNGGETSGGAAGTGGSGNPDSKLGTGVMDGSGRTSERYETQFVSRDDTSYVLITNGWGPGFGSHTISWEGTSFIVESMTGSRGSQGQPASYPSVFCGRYSVAEVPDCGLPARRDSITTLRTGWRWAANGNTGKYNAAYDIWVGNGTQFQGYLMVWLRDPPGEQPAGQPNAAHQGITVQNVPGTWNIWDGTVNARPIINWVRAEGEDSSELEFDVMDFIRDAEARGLNVPGTHIHAVAVGFEIWEGPISNLESVDFYIEVN